ncbi:MAG: hypothetical protein LC808_40740 [Actinobacteria bacterium]|nr:hypothetical protein [Actinomycetota bacterium]
MVRYTKPEATDDPGYLDWVEATVVGVEEAINTKQTYVVKIDNWFGKRWLGFSGKALGALGVRKQKLTLPPFIPTRVVSHVGCLKAMPLLVHANDFMCGNAAGKTFSDTLKLFCRAQTRSGTAVVRRRTTAEASWRTSQRRTGTGPGT